VFPSVEPLEEDQETAVADRLAAAMHELELAGPLRGARCSVEVDDRLVHFDLAEGDFEVQGDSQLQAIAAACLAELLGDDVDSHEVRWSLQAGGRHLFIAGVPRSIVTPLAAIADRQGSRLASIQPGFVRHWNAFARALPKEPALFAVVSGTHVVVACVVGKAIRGISIGQSLVTPADATVSAPTAALTATAASEVSSLDERVARLLASLGIEQTDATEFIVVSSDPVPLTASPRWKVVQPVAASS
jgi:hypothetical protein